MTHSSNRPQFNKTRRRRTYQRRKVCRFCADKTLAMDFKKPEILKTFTTDRGKMIPRRITGTCAKHQRHLSTAIKQARYMALLPYAAMAGRH